MIFFTQAIFSQEVGESIDWRNGKIYSSILIYVKMIIMSSTIEQKRLVTQKRRQN